MVQQVVFLPYAGGSKFAYRNYVKNLPVGVEGILPELPGHGMRMQELPLTSLQEVVEDLYKQIRPQLKGPYIIYGHSMGSLLGFLLTKYLLQKGDPIPQYCAFTGTMAPSQTGKRVRKLHLLPKHEFWAAIYAYGGTPQEIRDTEAYQDLVENIFRTDFQLVETYKHEAFKLPVPVLVINGSEENITPEEVNAWRNDVNNFVEIQTMPGHHFFIQGKEPVILQTILSFSTLIQHPQPSKHSKHELIKNSKYTDVNAEIGLDGYSGQWENGEPSQGNPSIPTNQCEHCNNPCCCAERLINET
ncbi:surfactin synthase thioesterase subunit [Chitinophaga skermanii]|uniref:Surfactin synthase thioesterase subunit n=1 Tax=Chitinophaga skermanii TaxID=331697 RepID=A0A327RB38_9BACT|nr:alpha/beta fold hydrolase [Chitinophaga skermanii]RAJ11147.1 surfactin synthase thioesterase subunit [Chitinophaga skermanii]